jgi:hypothetical protein
LRLRSEFLTPKYAADLAMVTGPTPDSAARYALLATWSSAHEGFEPRITLDG